jgi:hypothetical protein
MNLEIFILNGYGYFVWPAFIFTFLSCLFLYLKTEKELKKQEKIFSNHFKVSEVIKIEVVAKKEIEKKTLSGKPVLQ